MAVRSIIDVVVNTGAFQRFASMYARYQQTLPATVQAWQQINNRVGLASASMRAFNATSSAAASSWRTIASHTANVASSLKSATDSLLRWASISTIVSGLLGVGSLFGLDRLAGGVGRGRREATGVGTTYGQQTAFDLSYGRFVDHSFLGRVSEAASDPTRSWVLRRLGATPETLAGGNSADIARQILPALERFAKNTDPRQLGLLAKAYHYTDIISEQELKALRASLPGELAGQNSPYLERVSKFNRSTATESQYQSFYEKLDEAGKAIENAFVKGLQPLIPKLTELSGVLTDIVIRFLHEVKPSDVTAIANGIGSLATYLGSDEFKAKLDLFIGKVEELGDSLIKLAEKLHLITGPPLPAFQHAQTASESAANTVARRGLFGTITDPVGTALDIARGVGSPAQEAIPLPRSRPNVFGSVAKPDTNPRIGGGTIEENAKNNFNDRFYFNNQSSQEITVTARSPAGSSGTRPFLQTGTGAP